MVMKNLRTRKKLDGNKQSIVEAEATLQLLLRLLHLPTFDIHSQCRSKKISFVMYADCTAENTCRLHKCPPNVISSFSTTFRAGTRQFV
jgi:hypothetical protein